MNPTTRDRLAIGLMSGSLLLLLLFLIFWLYRVYDEQQEGLRKESNFIFQDAIRTVEDSIFQHNFLQPLLEGMQDSIANQPIEQNNGKTTIVFKQHTSVDMTRDSVFAMAMKARFSKETKAIKESGSISLLTSLSMDDLTVDPLSIFRRSDSTVITLLQPLIQQSIEQSDLPQAFRIVSLDSNAVESYSPPLWASYTDVLTKNKWAIIYPAYRPHLLRRMVPHILFSIFLFSCISLAFFLVYRSLRQQRQLTQLKNDLISNISHELKTPITTVGVAIEALRSFDALQEPERTKEYLDISKNELGRLSILIDKVLKMTSFEQTEMDLALEPVELQELLREIQASMKLQVEKFAAQLRFRSTGTAFTIKGDRIHLTSVIYNLIDNALKYSLQNPTIHIALKDDNEQVIISVRDEGIGIAKEYKDKIFEKFFRIPTGDTHNVKGHGLGLSYVANVVQKHSGRIEVDSQAGQGTCFTIYFPKHE
ncbi:MAG: HAMP domain-containing sensor histidine kinase [Bacteroidota bacterium]